MHPLLCEISHCESVPQNIITSGRTDTTEFSGRIHKGWILACGDTISKDLPEAKGQPASLHLQQFLEVAVGNPMS